MHPIIQNQLQAIKALCKQCRDLDESIAIDNA